jgi:hypothetical protein
LAVLLPAGTDVSGCFIWDNIRYYPARLMIVNGWTQNSLTVALLTIFERTTHQIVVSMPHQMKILQTNVFPRVNRNAAVTVLQADMRQGMPLLFCLADKKAASISGCQRLSKAMTAQHCRIHDSGRAKISNFSKGCPPLNESDVDTIVRGLGTRFPCDYGWIMSVHSPDVLLSFFDGKSDPVNQNSFLPGACNVFCFGAFGALALAVRALELDTAIVKSEGDDVREPFGTENWAYMQFILDEKERLKVAEMMQLRGVELRQCSQVVAKSVKSSGPADRRASGVVARVSLSSIAKRHFKKMGYVWNRFESERRVTVLDKVTARGNVIRITADAGGGNEVIPYVDAKFIGATFVSEPVSVVSAQSVTQADELQSLLEAHEQDLHYYEQQIASIYDYELGQCDLRVTKLIQEHRIRRIA